jgi:adenosine deaminase
MTSDYYGVSGGAVKSFIERIPKAELHVHIEGTLEPEFMFELASRNGIRLPYKTPAEARKTYQFSDLQSFLDIYDEGTRVLVRDRDFYDLTWAYLQKANEQNIRHSEIFFDPQTHTARGVPIAAIIEGIHQALDEGEAKLGISSQLILCFLRHLSAEEAMLTLEAALPYREYFSGVGLDSSERGHPPEKFTSVFARARQEGLFAVAHAGEEGPAAYIWQALDILRAERIDHGVRCIEDAALVERVRSERIPLTVCPLSNVRLRVFDSMKSHNLPQLLDAGICITINSDDPAYFGGYINENFRAIRDAFDLTEDVFRSLARNSIEASFMDETRRREILREIDDIR